MTELETINAILNFVLYNHIPAGCSNVDDYIDQLIKETCPSTHHFTESGIYMTLDCPRCGFGSGGISKIDLLLRPLEEVKCRRGVFFVGDVGPCGCKWSQVLSEAGRKNIIEYLEAKRDMIIAKARLDKIVKKIQPKQS